MAILPSPNVKTLTLNSSELFIKSYTEFIHGGDSPQTSPPLSFTLLSEQSLLPHIPKDIPQSKLIPKTRFIIDGFRNSGNYSVSYFLSHFHSDHYTGLNPSWAKGMIFCSKITAKLLVEVLNVSPLFVVELSLNEVVCIDGCEITLIDANHCPGAVQFLFRVAGRKGKKDKRYVHTGDFRFCNSMKLEPMLSEFVGADGIFLDTTYCNPRFNFPTQDESLEYIVEMINRIRVENKGLKKSVLFLIATYVVGKERILLEVSRKCKCMIHVDNRKMTVFSALGFGETGMFTEDASLSDVHVIGWNMLGETWPYFRPNFVKMKEIMIERGYSKVVGFVPTGWMYKVKRDGFPVKSKDSFEIHLVPYSEHSSYDELREYVRFLKPKRVIPTVGLDIEKLDSKHAIAMRKHFAGLVDEMANKQEFLMGFHRNSLQTEQKEEVEHIIDPNKGVGEQKEEVEHIIDPNKGVGEQKEEVEHIIDPNKEVGEQKEEVEHIIDPDTGVGGALHLEFQEKSNNTALDSVSDSRSMLKVPGSNDSMANDKDPEETIQELRDCLPVWVSRDQMLDLLTRSGGNIIEAVSDFYERETEYHEHVIACRESFVGCQASPSSDSVSFPELVSNKGTPHVPVVSTSAKASLLTNPTSFPALLSNKSTHSPVVTPLTRAKKSTNMTPSIKRTVSPRKRGSGLESRKNKKARQNSKLDLNGSKQATITKFFSKLVSSASQDDGVGSAKSEQCPSNENLLPCDAVEPYKEEVNQFLELIDGSISTTHAASILEKANGDINIALDIYNNSCGEIENKEERLVFHSKSAQTQSCVDNCSAGNEKKSSEETKNISTLYVQGLSTGNVTATHVSLPLEKYSPIEHACWCVGQPAPYLHLARTFDLLEGEKGKIKSTNMLCNMFRSLLALSPKDVLPAVYLCTNKIAADHENRELNVGGGTVTSALEEACGTNRSKIREMYNNLGDLGDVAQLCRQTQTLLVPPCALSIQQVFSVLQKLSVETGSGSSVRKKNLILNLMRSCREKEMKFLVRTLVRNLRIGAMMRTVLPALAQSVVINSSPNCLCERGAEGLKEKLQSISAAVVEAYNILPNLDLLVPSLLNKGTEFSSTTLSMIPGVPIKPMLARITNGVPQSLKLFQGRAFTCEYKYDGQRAQIHKLADGSVRVFSRNGDETTFKFPDLVDIIKQSSKPTAITFIVDAEVVAVDKKNGCKLMSFQELSTRERGNKSSFIEVDSIKVDICVFVFDIMFSNGEQLLGYPLRRRRQYLKELFLDDKLSSFGYAKEITVEAEDSCSSSEATLTKINSFLEDSIRSSCEGIMVKSLDVDAGYAPSKRTDTWLKVKRDYLEGLNDSLDLVPIGAWYGNGRKAGWYSPFLMACYNPDTEEFQSVCRVMSGFSDVFYLEMKEFFSDEKVLSKKPPYYQTSEVPDKWFSPELVWEIKGADFTISPVHQAAIGLVHPSRGISIRFPRFLRSVTDRKVEDCSTSEDVADMFRSQTRKMDISIED